MLFPRNIFIRDFMFTLDSDRYRLSDLYNVTERYGVSRVYLNITYAVHNN